MARDHARIFHRIWDDPEFLRRPLASQRAYLLLVSQRSMNYAGVLDLTVGRWARYAPDTMPDDVREALADLEEHRFVVVDPDTEELLVRTFIRNDELCTNVRLLRVAVREALGTQSPTLRLVLADELARLPRVVIPELDKGRGSAEARARAAAEARACQEELDEAVVALGSAPAAGAGSPPAAAPGSAPVGQVQPAPAAAPGPAPSPGGTRTRAIAPVGDGDGDVVGAGDVVAFEARELDLEGGVTEVDARGEQDDDQPPAVPDTEPAPLEAPDPEADQRAYDEFVAAARQRTAAPPAPVIEGAMPPRRCRNHLAKPDDWDGACGRCKDARIAQEAWIADRDAKVATARAQVQAEIAEERRLERAAIDACSYCDERGVTPHGVRCAHTGPVEEMPPGRAAAKRAMTELAERRERRKATEPASGEQLQRLAIAFGRHGNTDRDARIAWCNANLRREITSSTQLTVAEASQLIDVLDAQEPSDEVAEYREAVALNAAMGEPDPEPDIDSDDGTEPEPEGDPDVEGEYLADQATWTTDDDEPAAYSYAGGPDEPPF